MDEQEEFDKIIGEIKDRMDANPELREKIKSHVESIEEIFGYPIEVSLVYLKGVSEYIDIFNDYDDEEIDLSQTMTLGDFIDFIKVEDRNLDFAIDPIHLKRGINGIVNVLVTTVDDKVIIVPLTSKEDE